MDQSMGASVDKQGSLGLDQGMETENTHGPTGLTQLLSVPTTQLLVSTSEFLHLFPLPRKLFPGSPPRSGLSMNVGCAGRLTLSNPQEQTLGDEPHQHPCFPALMLPVVPLPPARTPSICGFAGCPPRGRAYFPSTRTVDLTMRQARPMGCGQKWERPSSDPPEARQRSLCMLPPAIPLGHTRPRKAKDERPVGLPSQTHGSPADLQTCERARRTVAEAPRLGLLGGETGTTDDWSAQLNTPSPMSLCSRCGLSPRSPTGSVRPGPPSLL